MSTTDVSVPLIEHGAIKNARFGHPRGLDWDETTGSRRATSDAVQDILLRERVTRRSLAGADIIAAFLAVLASLTITGERMTWVAAVVPVIVVLVAKIQGLYDRDDLVMSKSTLGEWRVIVQAAMMSTVGVYLLWRPLTGDHTAPGMRVFALAVSLLAALMLLGRLGARRLIHRVSPPERCLIIGSGPGSADLATRLSALPGVESLGVIRSDKLGASLADVRSLADQMRVHRLIVTLEGSSDASLLELIRSAKWLGIRVSLFPSVMAAVGSCAAFDDVDGMTLLGVPRFGLSRSSRMVKRTFDLTIAIVACVLLLPVVALLAILIKLDSRGPVFFRQTRVGQGGRHFKMIKFRSMVVDAEALKAQLMDQNEAADGLFKITKDPRITRVGRVIRSSHIDELPQLWNVIRGEMSLVGPRPLIETEDALLAGSDRYRLCLTPGVTGPWQVRGPLTTPLNEMAKLDYLYVSSWSLWEDVEILVRTVARILVRGGH